MTHLLLRQKGLAIGNVLQNIIIKIATYNTTVQPCHLIATCTPDVHCINAFYIQ